MGRTKTFDRTEVLEKAMPLFWKRGFADTGLQDLEKATGVNKSGLYSEFKNKDDLFLESLRLYTKTRKARELLSVEPMGWNNIETYLKARLSSKNIDGLKGCFAVNSMRELEVLPKGAQQIMTDSRSSLKLLFLKNIQAEKTKMAAEDLTEVLSTFFSGLAIEQNMKAGKSPIQKIEDFMRLLRSM